MNFRKGQSSKLAIPIRIQIFMSSTKNVSNRPSESAIDSHNFGCQIPQCILAYEEEQGKITML